MTDAQNDEIDSEGVIEDEQPTGALGAFYALAWRFFCSLRLTVFVLFTLAAGCVIGMFFDQTLTLEEHRAEWASAAWKLWLYERLELNDVFHSWWFGSVIILLALNLTACSIERLPKIWIDIKNPQKELTDKQLRGIRHIYRSTIQTSDVPRALALISGIFGHDIKNKVGETTYVYNEKHRYARTGVYIVHIALLMIMFGSIAVTYNGIDGMMMVVEGSYGRFVRVKGPGGLTFKHDLGFRVKCTDFRLKTYIDGSPMDFESDLEIYDDAALSNPVIKKTIQVNDPLEYKGYTFYQASYNPIPGDQLVQLDICKRPTTAEEIPAYEACKKDARNIHVVSIGDRVQMADGTAFVPIEIQRDYGGLGGAVRVQKIYPDQTTTSFVVFRNYPDFDLQVRRGEYVVGFRGFDQQYATGIQVGAVPYINIVFFAFLLMFSGMYMAFFMSHRRYWARITENDDGTVTLMVAGAARRHQFAFEEEFTKIRDRLTEVFGAEKSAAERARELREKRKAEKEARKAQRALENDDN